MEFQIFLIIVSLSIGSPRANEIVVTNGFVTNKFITNKFVTNKFVTNKFVTNKFISAELLSKSKIRELQKAFLHFFLTMR